MSKARKITEMFDNYIEMTFLKGNMLKNQELEIKRAFYAGIGEFIIELQGSIANSEEHDAIKQLDSLEKECLNFWKETCDE